MDFSRFHNVSSAKSVTYDAGLRSYMIQVYNFMALGLVTTGVVAFAVGNSPALLAAIFGTPLRYVVMFAPLVMVFYLGFKVMTMPYESAKRVFWFYSALMGLSLSAIFAVYTGESIARAFFITAGMFGGMSLYGYTTKKDLTSLGSFMIMGAIGLMILSIINLFMHSSAMSNFISVVAIFVFVGLTAYDTQRIKQTYYYLGGSSDVAKKAGLMGALSLYMDFINIFISLLHLLNERK